MTSPPLLQISNLTRRDRRSGQAIVQSVDLSLRAGERLGLVGPSGCGKSSLLRAIIGLDGCDDGHVRFLGEPISDDQFPAFRRQVVYLHQRPAWCEGTVEKNLRIPFQWQSARSPFPRDQVLTSLERLGQPSSLLAQPIEQLSGGQQQLIALIRALSLEPCVLLLDEPTASLDPVATAQVEAHLERWMNDSWSEDHVPSATTQRALIWTSHDAEQISRVATRVARMKEGNLETSEA